jgi:hypothetical protein
MRPRCLAALAVPLLLAGCADLVTPIDRPTTAAPTSVRITMSTSGVHGPVYLQGMIRFVRITGEGPDTQANIRKELEVDGDTRVKLPAGGVYQIASWARPCGKTCDTLHRSVGRCSMSFTATAGQVTTIEIRASMRRDCSITVGG